MAEGETSMTDVFSAAVTLAEGRRQAAMALAEKEFTASRAAILNAWTAKVQAVRTKWEAVRSNANHPDHDAAKVDFDRLEQSGGPDYSVAYQARAEQVARID